MTDFRDRISQRFPTDIAVLACSVVESRAARIVDLSTHGAKVESDKPYTAGQQIALELQGERVFGIVTWSEIDRMGIEFLYPLIDGVFREALDAAIRNTGFQGAPAAMLPHQRPVFGRRPA